MYLVTNYVQFAEAKNKSILTKNNLILERQTKRHSIVELSLLSVDTLIGYEPANLTVQTPSPKRLRVDSFFFAYM